jgi:hypothetical protein
MCHAVAAGSWRLRLVYPRLWVYKPKLSVASRGSMAQHVCHGVLGVVRCLMRLCTAAAADVRLYLAGARETSYHSLAMLLVILSC